MSAAESDVQLARQLISLIASGMDIVSDPSESNASRAAVEMSMPLAIRASPPPVILAALEILLSESGLPEAGVGKIYMTGTGQRLVRVHDEAVCHGTPCVIHAPIAGQPWSAWPTHWRADRRIMERLCPCGIGHPAVEDVLGLGKDGVHGCCGCPCSASPEVARMFGPTMCDADA